MSLRKTGLPSVPVPSGSVSRSMSMRAGERVGDDQRRRREVVRAHLGVDAALEVAVAAEHRRDDEVALPRSPCEIGSRQRPAVADAGRAAVADEVEAELLEVRHEARLREVLGDDLRAGREARLHPRLASSGPCSTAFFASSPAATITDGFDVFVQLVIAAMTTEPCVSSTLLAVDRWPRPSRRGALGLRRLRQRSSSSERVEVGLRRR